MGIPLYVICCFSFAAFNICPLCLIFVSLINMCFSIFLPGFILFWTLWASWTWVAISFHTLGKFSAIISSNILSCPFLLSSSGTTMIRMLGHLNVVPGVSEAVLISFYSFLFICSASFISTTLSSSSLIHSSASVTLLLVPSSVFLISVITFFQC